MPPINSARRTNAAAAARASENITVAPAALASRDAATYIAHAEQTLRGWRHRGEGPPYVKVAANKVVYRIADLDAWMAENLVGGHR